MISLIIVPALLRLSWYIHYESYATDLSENNGSSRAAAFLLVPVHSVAAAQRLKVTSCMMCAKQWKTELTTCDDGHFEVVDGCCMKAKIAEVRHTS
jgi:hypothetical protein